MTAVGEAVNRSTRKPEGETNGAEAASVAPFSTTAGARIRSKADASLALKDAATSEVSFEAPAL